MSIQDGNPVNAAYTNSRVASKQDDNELDGIQSLKHNNITSGADILNLQKTVNDLIAILAALGTGNTVTNVGTGQGVFKEKVGIDLRFYTIKGTNNVGITLNGDDIEISHPVEFLSADPGSPTTDQLWFNTTDEVWRFYNGTSTIEIGSDYVDLSTNQTVGGQKTFTAKQFFSDEIEVTGKITALGDFQVDGTLTYVNSTNLDVTDPLVTINKGGNDATANGAGLDIERTGTNGELKFDDTLDSKFKIGLAGGLKEVQVIVKDSEANILGTGSPSTSVRYYATDTNKHYFYNGSTFVYVSNALEIQGVAVHTATPTDGQILEYVAANSRYEPKTPSAGGGSGAYDATIGSAETYADLAAFNTGATAGDNAFLKSETVASAVTFTKELNLHGGGKSSQSTGNVTFDTGSNNSTVRNVYIKGTLTIKTGVRGLYLNGIYMDDPEAQVVFEDPADDEFNVLTDFIKVA